MKSLRNYPLYIFFFYLLLVFLPSQLGYHTWPSWSLILGRRVDYLSPTLFFTDILFLFVCGFFLLTNRKMCWDKIRKLVIPSGLLIGIACINIFFAQVKILSVLGWLKIFELLLLFCYIRFIKSSISHIVTGLSIGVITSSLIGIAQILLHSSTGLFWILGERIFTLQTPNIAKGVLCMPKTFSCIEYLRPYGTFPHPNVFAGFLAVYILICTEMLRERTLKKNILNKYFQFTIILAMIMLLLTSSKSAIFALVAVLSLRGLRRFISNTKIVFLATLIGITCSILLLFPLPHLDQESVDVRIALNSAALTVIRQYPFTGVGKNNFLAILPSYLPLRTIYFLQPVHNIYLLFVAEFGIPLSILMVGICIRYIKRNPSLLFRLPTSPFFLLLLIGCFDHYPVTLQQGQLLFALSFALLFLPRI